MQDAIGFGRICFFVLIINCASSCVFGASKLSFVKHLLLRLWIEISALPIHMTCWMSHV
jgi:hypothetical protein